MITGPQRAAHAQIAAEDAGLAWVTTIAARRAFALLTRRRPASAHWAITVLCRGALGHTRRVFHPPSDLPGAQSGTANPLDWWEDNGRADRPGLLRYDNSLPLPLVRRIVEAFSDPVSTSSTRPRRRHHADRLLADRAAVHRRRPELPGGALQRRPAARRARLAGRTPTPAARPDRRLTPRLARSRAAGRVPTNQKEKL